MAIGACAGNSVSAHNIHEHGGFVFGADAPNQRVHPASRLLTQLFSTNTNAEKCEFNAECRAG